MPEVLNFRETDHKLRYAKLAGAGSSPRDPAGTKKYKRGCLTFETASAYFYKPFAFNLSTQISRPILRRGHFTLFKLIV